MWPLWRIVGMLIVAGLLVGCGDGASESTATPANLDAARDAAKKMQLREAAAKQKALANAKPEAPKPDTKK